MEALQFRFLRRLFRCVKAHNCVSDFGHEQHIPDNFSKFANISRSGGKISVLASVSGDKIGVKVIYFLVLSHDN